jgi:peptidoglycan/xylan/chitin deacetylase (PgdA/CDA1 family)
MRPLVLMYHRVNTLRPDPWTTSVSPAHFVEHMEMLRALSIRPVITFDDGYADNFEHARPILERFDMPATIFVISGMVGSPYEMWWDELERQHLQDTAHDWDWGGEDPDQGAVRYRAEFERYRREPFVLFPANRPLARPERRMMSHAEVASLVAGGLVEIGAHTVTHPVLSQLSLQGQQQEIGQSKLDLEEMTGGPVRSFAYPNGFPADYTQDAVAIAKAAGFTRAFAAWDASQEQPADTFEIPRIMVRDWDGDQFAALVSARFA